MYKKTLKLLGIILLLLLSFIYTSKVFSIVKENDPIIKSIKKYKKENDIKPTEAMVNESVIKVGNSGKLVNVEASYEDMKKDNKFNKDKIVYDKVYPKNTLKNKYNYFIESGNMCKKGVSILFKVENEKNLSEILNLSNKYKTTINLFVNTKYLLKNIDDFWYIKQPFYNLNYDNNKADDVNSLIEDISNNSITYCLNENRVVYDLKTCAKKKQHTISPKFINPSTKELKQYLGNGMIILYDLENFDINSYSYIIKTIKSKGYNIVSLDKNLSE